MTLNEFINKYNGVKCGDTPENFSQCVGLVELWGDNLGKEHIWGNAKDLLNNADRTSYDVIYNSPFNSPQAGDILVFNSSWGGGYGHTGVVVNASIWSFDLFEQNNPIGEAPHVLHHSTMDYFSVLGWLHPKTVDPIQTTADDIKAKINSSLSDDDFKNYIVSLDKSLLRNALRKLIGI